MAERVGEHFGAFQDHECKQMKDSLVKIEDSGTGRVLLSDFYKPGLDGQWQFQESVAYLRQLGALDESNPSRPSVIIANYLNSPTNCIASSSFYSVCCMDECEGLLGHLEQKIAAPEATSTHIAARTPCFARSCALRLLCRRSGVEVLTASGAIVRARLQRIAWQLQPTSTSMLRGWRPERPSSNATVLFLLAPGCGGRWAPSCLRSC